jgi:hypothetical protein
MRINHFRLLVLFVFIGTTQISCLKDQVTERYTLFRPVYSLKANVKAAIGSSPATSIVNPGKIFVKGNYVFLNEIDRGIHVIDFSNPANPRNLAFVNIPGCVDMAVRANYLYADLYTDLVTLDITDPLNVKVQQYQEAVFPNRVYSNGFMADTTKFITNWIRVDTVLKKDHIPQGFTLALGPMSRELSSSAINGQGGSMARFGLLDDRMYTVSNKDLRIFNTSNPASPNFIKTIKLNRGDIETIFPYQKNLFIGTESAMMIFSATDKDNPTYVSTFSHARACDPVIADQSFAYVTLRSNNLCRGFVNQLDVVDVTQLLSPRLVKTYLLTQPAGLSKDQNWLFICDGSDGLKIFDATRPDDLRLLKTIPLNKTYDVIAINGIALTVAEDGIYFIDYRNPDQAFITGKITINKS